MNSAVTPRRPRIRQRRQPCRSGRREGREGGAPAIPGIGIAERALDAIYNEHPAVIRERTRKTLAGYGLSTAEVEGFMNAPLNVAPEEAPAGPAGRP